MFHTMTPQLSLFAMCLTTVLELSAVILRDLTSQLFLFVSPIILMAMRWSLERRLVFLYMLATRSTSGALSGVSRRSDPLKRESDFRANAHGELLSVREAVAAETVAANAAVAAAATAAAAEAAAASKAAKAAAAANERRARGCGRRKKTTSACALHGALSTRNTSRASPATA